MDRNPDRAFVDLQLTCDAPGLPGVAEIGRWIGLAIDASGKSPERDAEISVRVVDAAEMQSLNRRYRGKDRPTNVLAFTADLDHLPGLPAGDRQLLGDLVLCAEVVAREAREQGKAPCDHWAHLLVHGTLHLLGFDHRNSDEADTMESLETRILTGQGLTNPYEDRHLS